jgi:ubiquinone/menaquinone biosynthesis C-methylase UbiE
MESDWKERAKNYNHLDWVNNDRLLNEMMKNVDFMTSETNVLDIGTGTGKVLLFLKLNKGNANYYGVDLSIDMLNQIDPKLKFNLMIGDSAQMDFYHDDFFHLVTARMVLHHIKDFNKVMQEVYRKLKKGGIFIVCEGNPPSLDSYQFYMDMFHYKEQRHVFMEHHLINLFIRNHYKDVTLKSVLLENMSLNNWLRNSGLPERNIDIIKKMHYNCPEIVQRDYNMNISNNDLTMDWKFSIVTGKK